MKKNIQKNIKKIKQEQEKDNNILTGSTPHASCENSVRVSEWYDRVVSSLDKCVFCDLRDKYVIDEKSQVVLTVSLFPYSEGHLLIIPKRHVEVLSELSDSEWDAIKYFLLKTPILIKHTLGIEDTNVIYRQGGESSGKSLGHLHWHVMPMQKGFLNRTTDGIKYTFQPTKNTPSQMADLYRSNLQKLNALSSKESSGSGYWNENEIKNQDEIKNKDGSGISLGNKLSPVGLMRKACLLCDNSKCGYKTGCVVVVNGEIVAQGWNETLPGEVYCQNGECIRITEHLAGGKDIHRVCSIHAEASCIAQCAQKGISVEGACVFVSTFPCIICSRLLAKAKIARLYYMSDYMGGLEGMSLFEKNNISVTKLEEKDIWKQ